MQNEILATLSRLSDADLVARVKSLVGRERDATAQIIAHLAELDTRDVHLREGYDSLYVYCRDALGFSEWEAYNRIEVARSARRFPVILDMLAEGSLHLTAVRLLAPHLTPSNHHEVLESARGKPKAEVQAIIARLSPRRDVPSSIRRLPTPAPDPLPLTPSPATGAVSIAAAVAAGPLPVGRAAATPLSPDRYKLQVTIGGETLEKLRLAKDMLGHAIPSGDDAAVLDRALTVLLGERARKKFASTDKPRRSRGTRLGARQLSAAVKRAVWLRDLGRCAFIGTHGHRCNERRFVEFHHVDPWALGGEASVEKIELRCRRYNDYEGRLYFGKRRRGGDSGVMQGDGGVMQEDHAPYAACPAPPAVLVPEQVELPGVELPGGEHRSV
jgi:hypothetical protein